MMVTREWNNSGRIALILGARDEWLGSHVEYSTVATYADQTKDVLEYWEAFDSPQADVADFGTDRA